MAARRLCPPCGSERQLLVEVGRHYRNRANRRASGPPQNEAALTDNDQQSEGRHPERATFDAKIALAVLLRLTMRPWSCSVRPCAVGSNEGSRKPPIFSVRHSPHLRRGPAVFRGAVSPRRATRWSELRLRSGRMDKTYLKDIVGAGRHPIEHRSIHFRH